MDAVRKLILDKLLELGLTMSEASITIGKNHAYLQQFLKRGVPAQLGEEERARLSGLLQVPETALRGTSAPLPKREYVKLPSSVDSNPQPLTNMSETPHNSLDNPTLHKSLFGERNDLPVFGTAQGGASGALIVTNEAVDFVVRPAPLLRVRDGYGIIVAGDSMSPKFENGAIALVNPHLPQKNLDYCVFRKHEDDGTVLIMIKRLVRYNDAAWFVRQFNPLRDFSLKRSEWQVCHVTVGEYFGH